MKITPTQKVILVGLLGIAGLGLLFWLNFLMTRLADQHNNDFSTFWTAGRLLGQGISPYDHAATAATLDSIGNIRVNTLHLALAYPLWTIMLFVPLGALDIDIAAAIWLTLNEIMMAAVFFLTAWSMAAGEPLEKRPKLVRYLFLGGFIPFLTTVNFTECLLNGQFSFFALSGIALFIWAAIHQRCKLAGFALLVVLFKPTTVLLIAPIALLWLLRRRERWTGLYVFGAGSIFLIVLGFSLDPQMLQHIYDAGTPNGRAISFRGANLWGSCAYLVRETLGYSMEWLGWALAAVLALTEGWLGWRLFRATAIPAGPVREVTGWSLLLLLSLNLTYFVFGYENVALIVPLLVILAITRWYSISWKIMLGAALVLALWVLPYFTTWTGGNPARYGVFSNLMVGIMLTVLHTLRKRHTDPTKTIQSEKQNMLV